MKKITDIKEGDLIPLATAAKLFEVPAKRLYEWRARSKMAPDQYPRSAKIGGIVFFLKSDILEFLNRQFNQAS